MPTPRFEAAVRRRVDQVHRELGEEMRRLRDDTGLSRLAVARAAGVDSSYLARVEDGRERASSETLIRVGLVLGADFRARLYPNTGPLIRDRHQGRMLEALLGSLHPRWQAFAEVAVHRPSRGWIDAALHDRGERLVVATELQSELRRLEQLVRWQGAKADALPSWDGWQRLPNEPAISRLMLVRRTRATRTTAREYGRQLRLAYPAHPDDARAALTGDAPWPGAALVWTVIDGAGARLIAGR